MRPATQTDRTYIEAKAEAMEDKTRALVAEVRAEMHKNTADIIKWMVGMTITFLATCISVMAFMLNSVTTSISNVNANVTAELNRMNATLTAVARQSVPAPVAPPAPVIIQLPPYPAAPRP